MRNCYETNLRGFNFEYLKGTRFQNVYDTLNAAKKLNEVDKGSCCTKLRYALEIIISEVIDICGLKKYKKQNINRNIMLIQKHIPGYLRQYNGEDIVIEMHNVRLYGNDGTHYDDGSYVDLDKATHTSWIAMRKICKWVIGLEPLYAQYIEAENVRKAHEAEEERKRKTRETEEERRKKEERKATVMKCLKWAGAAALAVIGGTILNQIRKNKI